MVLQREMLRERYGVYWKENEGKVNQRVKRVMKTKARALQI